MFRLLLISSCVMTLCSMLNSSYATLTPIHQDILIRKDVKHDVSLPLRYLQSSSVIKKYLFAKNEPLLRMETLDILSLIPLHGFQGIGEGLGNYQVTSTRPDPAASVGLTQYVEWVNTDIGVFDKMTGQIAAGFPKPGNSIWAGFGGPCETTNMGSATVKYDQLANRWVLSQQAFENAATGPFYRCFAISTSEDATGTYNRYAFPIEDASNYARLGLWPDGYYMAFNFNGSHFVGPEICAFERDKMLTGQAATMQCKQFSSMQTNPLLPADLDGRELPPAGSPEFFMSLDEPGSLLVSKFFVDFVNPNNTHTLFSVIPVSNFTKSCRNLNGNNCAIQPNTSNRLNVYSDRIMRRLAYRQFRDYGSLVVNHTIEGVPPKFSPAIRWYELRIPKTNTNFDPIVYQQSTIQPDSENRFAGSIAIDRFTNIAIGYTLTSSLIFPSMELSYHQYYDQLNVTTIQPLVTGSGSQINGVSDWGSHSMMSIDPIDQCTFWYTGEYLKTDGSLNWSTFVTQFKLAACQ